jgi:type VII secretion protein EssB
MRTEIDGTFLELDSSPGVLRVEVAKTGYRAASVDVIRRYVNAQETETGVVLTYTLGEGEIEFRKAVDRASTRLDRLALAQKLATCLDYRGSFTVPLIHPDNVSLTGDRLRVVHSGLHGILAPRVFDDAEFLGALQAMVLQVFRPTLTFEQLRDGSKGLRDKFSTQVLQAATPDELFAFIDQQFQDEHARVTATKVRVTRTRYRWYRALGAVGVLVGVAAGGFAWWAQGQNQLQSAVVASQARFLASDYAGTMDKLDGYAASSLPSSAKYVLAVSSIHLADLTATQKQAILNNISEKSDDVTLNYWIASGRGEFEQALDYAKNLGDDQLTLLAYTDLYQATKLDSGMSGEKKQERLTAYAKAIDELTAKLDGTDSKEAHG